MSINKRSKVAEFSERLRSAVGNTDGQDSQDAVTNGFVFIRTSHDVSAPGHHTGLDTIRVFDRDLYRATTFPSCSYVVKLTHKSL